MSSQKKHQNLRGRVSGGKNTTKIVDIYIYIYYIIYKMIYIYIHTYYIQYIGIYGDPPPPSNSCNSDWKGFLHF